MHGELRATLTTKRNDPRIKSHNRLMHQNWCANVDVQIIVDVTACMCTVYGEIYEPTSKVVSTIFADSINKLRSHSTTATAIRMAMIQSVGERDFSAQETAHLLLSLPLYSCTYSFVTI